MAEQGPPPEWRQANSGVPPEWRPPAPGALPPPAQPPAPYGAPAYGPPPGYGYVQHVMVQPVGTNALAVMSCVVGALSWLLCPFVGAVIAIVMGHIARGQVRRTGSSGDGWALAGLILGYAHLVIYGLVVLVVVFFGVGLAAIGAGAGAGH